VCSAQDKERCSSAPRLGHPTMLNCYSLLRATTRVVFFTIGATELVTVGILSEKTLLVDMFMAL